MKNALQISAAVSIALMLAACSGGGRSPTLTDAELDRLEADPRMMRAEGILERADAVLMSGIHSRYYLSFQGPAASDRWTMSDSSVERPVCAGARCVYEDGTEFDLADLFDPHTEAGPNPKEVNIGSRGGFDTLEIKGVDLPVNIPDAGVTNVPSASAWGFWGRYGLAQVVTVDGPLSGQAQGVSYDGGMRAALAWVTGDETGTNPTGMGSATWNGIAEAASIRTFERRQGTATVSIADLSRPRVSVEIDISGFAIGSPAWTDMPLADGRFVAGTVEKDRLEGNFLGSDHGEAYGVFDTDAYVGAFGAKRVQ